MRNGPSLLCINGFDINLENCEGEMDCKQTLLIAAKKWRSSKLLQDLTVNHGKELNWEVERERSLSYSVVFSVREDMYSPYPLSIWFSSFQNRNKDYSSDYLFNGSDVKKWISEVRSIVCTLN